MPARFLTLALCLLLPGCIIAIGNASPSPQAVYYPAGVLPTLTMNEINAAAALDFESSRTALLRNIAARPTLTPPEQVHLVHVTLHRLSFDSNRELVMNDLIANPAFSPEAKNALLLQLPQLSFDSTRSQLLTALQNRPLPVPPAPPTTAPTPGPAQQG